MNDRFISEAKKIAVVLFTGLLYYVFNVITGIYIPCMFFVATGLRCPACGITHMIQEIICLDFRSAFHYNPFLFIMWPFILFPIGYSEYRYIKYGDRKLGKFDIMVWILIGLLLAFGVARNIWNI